MVQRDDLVVVMVAGWMVVRPKPRLLVGGGVVMPDLVGLIGVDQEVELARRSVMVKLLHDLQHMRW